jgi:dihydroneopterin triphosphate diphosphatase
MGSGYKIPRSVLVVIHTSNLEVLLLERVIRRGFWQSVTGSQDLAETLEATARREVSEETGLDTRTVTLQDWKLSNEFQIFAQWRSRYAPGVTRNTEHVFSLEVPAPFEVRIAPDEHSAYQWVEYARAAELCFSWSNRDALNLLPRMRKLLDRRAGQA